jgi:hypothetical protein
MSARPSSAYAANAPRLFEPLEQNAFRQLKHAASLKGLLKPFKSKGELEDWRSHCESLRDSLTYLAQRLVRQATAYPFSMLPVMLAQQSTGAGTTFLRWRTADRSAMGVMLWDTLIADPKTPLPLVHELFALELERITLNMQISLTHSIARQAQQCVEKMARAEALYQQRVGPPTDAPSEGVAR